MAKYITVDYIVRSALIRRELTMHWYWPYLKSATDCYRELHFDVLGRSRTKLVDVVDGRIKWPCDYVDYIGVWQDDDSRVGRRGWIGVDRSNRETEELVLTSDCKVIDGKAILEYTTDGSDCDAASRVHPFAQDTIESYIFWQQSPNRDNELSPEGRKFKTAIKRLRGRMNPLTTEDINEIARRKTHIQVNRWSYEEAEVNVVTPTIL